MLTTDGFTKPVAPSDGAKIFHRELGAVRGDGIRGRTRGAGHRAVDGQLVQGSRRHSMQRRISKLLGGALLGTVGAPVAIPAARHCR
jgi:hypothetical protein